VCAKSSYQEVFSSSEMLSTTYDFTHSLTTIERDIAVHTADGITATTPIGMLIHLILFQHLPTTLTTEKHHLVSVRMFQRKVKIYMNLLRSSGNSKIDQCTIILSCLSDNEWRCPICHEQIIILQLFWDFKILRGDAAGQSVRLPDFEGCWLLAVGGKLSLARLKDILMSLWGAIRHISKDFGRFDDSSTLSYTSSTLPCPIHKLYVGYFGLGLTSLLNHPSFYKTIEECPSLC
jgi:hypothetical protein